MVIPQFQTQYPVPDQLLIFLCGLGMTKNIWSADLREQEWNMGAADQTS